MYGLTPEQQSNLTTEVNEKLLQLQQLQSEVNQQLRQVSFINLEQVLNEAENTGWTNELCAYLAQSFFLINNQEQDSEFTEEEIPILQQAHMHYSITGETASNHDLLTKDTVPALAAHFAAIPTSEFTTGEGIFNHFSIALAVDNAVQHLRKEYPKERYHLIMIRDETSENVLMLHLDSTVKPESDERFVIDHFHAPTLETHGPSRTHCSAHMLSDTIAGILSPHTIEEN